MSRYARIATACASLCLTALSACGQVTQETHRAETAAFLRALKEAGAAGKTGTLQGNHYLALPGPPAVFRDTLVTLLPLPPDHETAITQAQERYLKAGREPLTAEAFQQARHLLERLAAQVKESGYEELIRTTKTDTKEAKFVFSDVPEGRWLLTSELPGKLSMLLWAKPVTVTAGKTTQQLLTDATIWLEGLTP